MDWTLFEYRYRDAGNYKATGAVALEGTITSAESSAVTAALQDGELFVAEQLGVPALFEARYRWSAGPTLEDHCWHEFVGFRAVSSGDIAPEVARLGSAKAFAARLAAIREWHCELSPHAGTDYDRATLC